MTDFYGREWTSCCGFLWKKWGNLPKLPNLRWLYFDGFTTRISNRMATLGVSPVFIHTQVNSAKQLKQLKTLLRLRRFPLETGSCCDRTIPPCLSATVATVSKKSSACCGRQMSAALHVEFLKNLSRLARFADRHDLGNQGLQGIISEPVSGLLGVWNVVFFWPQTSAPKSARTQAAKGQGPIPGKWCCKRQRFSYQAMQFLSKVVLRSAPSSSKTFTPASAMLLRAMLEMASASCCGMLHS